MIKLAPKVEQSIKRSSSKPVIYAEVLAGFLDKLISLYNDWTTTGSPDNNPDGLNYVMVQVGTVIVKENTLTANPLSMLQMKYPASGGDPILSSNGFEISRTSTDSPEAIATVVTVY